MNKSLSNFKSILPLLLLAWSNNLISQQKKVWASGQARSVFQQNKYGSAGDTVTPVMTNSGHALADLTLNASPNSSTYLNATIRVRNDFGGFWGSGVTFDLRQLYLKGLIKNSIRYQLGDINYKLTPFTFFSNSEELSGQQNKIVNVYRQMVHTDWFYNKDNTWRQQGAAVDFSLDINNKLFRSIDFDLFSSRVNPTDFQLQSERFFYGGNSTIHLGSDLQAGLNTMVLSDVKGTSKSKSFFSNAVYTGNVKYLKKGSIFNVEASGEFGTSKFEIKGGSDAGSISDFFAHSQVSSTHKTTRLSFTLKYINVGPGFRSVGAQTKRINFDALSGLYGRISNAQTIRPFTTLDLAQDASIYRYSFNPNLDKYLPWYDNMNPYGMATPNRKGQEVKLGWLTKDSLLIMKANISLLQEVVGQGVSDLRRFNGVQFQLDLNINKWLKSLKRDLTISMHQSMQNTERKTSLSQAKIDLKSSILDLGISWEFAKDFELVLSYRKFNAVGNEMMNVRNTLTEVTDFENIKADFVEETLSAALTYHFSSKSQIHAIWHKLNRTDKLIADNTFKMNQFAIVYILNF